MAQPLISARKVCRTYQMGAEQVHALREATLDIQPGQYVSIIGPSGSGKSTFFNMVGGLDSPTSGEVVVEGHRLADLTSDQLAWFRCHKIGFIFQSFNLIGTMTALENVSVSAIFAGCRPAEARDKAAAVLERVGLGHRLDHLPSQVSGGQQQRIAIARALVNRPLIILADEPTGNLDLHTGQEIINLLSEMRRDFGVTVVTATHDMKMLSTSDLIVSLRGGRVERVATPQDMNVQVGTIDGHTVA